MKNNFVIFTFYSTHLALEFENILKSRELSVKIIPVPREISSSCGLAGRILAEDYEEVRLICKKNNLEYEEIYKFTEAENILKKISWGRKNSIQTAVLDGV